MMVGMHTDQFIAELAGYGVTPGYQSTPDDDLRAYAKAALVMEELGPRIAKHTKSPVHAAYFVYTVERAHRATEYSQVLAAALAQRTLAHELPGQVFDAIAQLRTDPDGYIAGTCTLPADPRTVPHGRLLFKNTAEFLAQTLKINFHEARDRLQAAEDLLPHTDAHGIARPAHFQLLGRQLTDGAAAPRELKNAARKLGRLQPHINAQPDAGRLGTDMEAQVAESVRVQDPGTTNKLLDAMKATLEQNTPIPTAEVLRGGLGMFYQGIRGGIAEFKLRMVPADAEILHSLGAQADNPRTKAGNRDTLLQQSPFAVPETPVSPVSPASTAPPEAPAHGMTAFPNAEPASAVGDNSPMANAASNNAASNNAAPNNASSNTSVSPRAAESRPEQSFPDFLRNPETGQPLTVAEAQALSLDGPADDFVRGHPSAGESATTDPASPMADTVFGADRLTPAQRHLQALLNLLKANGQTGNNRKTAGLPAPEMVVITELSELEERAIRGGITGHGQHLDPTTLRQQLCTANVIPMVMNGRGQILDLGRSGRFFPDYMRRAILARDGGCLVPGCTVPPEHCEIHHLKPWEAGGGTHIDDGFPHCTAHHHAVHAGHIEDVHNDEGLPAVILPKFMDPEQLPRRNTYWNPKPAAFSKPAMLPLF